MSQLHSYETLASALKKAQFPYAPAELHGLLSGMLAVARPLTDAVLLARLASHVGAARWPVALIGDWKLLRDDALSGYQDEAMTFTMLLPETVDLKERTSAVIAWCEGFMAGFGEMAVGVKLPVLVNEGLGDLMAVSRVEIPAEPSDEDADMLVQIEEHCRMVAIAIFTEMAIAARAPQAAGKPAADIQAADKEGA